MKKVFCLFSWMWMALACESAEIVAWKIPLSNFASNGLKSKGIIRCQSAPETSPFFRPSDELWDLKGIPATDRIETGLSIIWVVWNESSGRLVTKSDLNGVWQLHQKLGIMELPDQCRLTLDIFTVPPDGSPATEKSVPSSSLTWITRSGMKSEASLRQSENEIHVLGEPIIYDDHRMINLLLVASCKLHNQPEIELNTGFLLQSGVPLWIARDFNEGKGIDFKISGVIELLDGTLRSETVLIQKGDTFSPFVGHGNEMERHRIGDNGWLVGRRFNLDEFANSINPNISADPFAEEYQENLIKSIDFPIVDVPVIIRPWFGARVLDIRGYLKNQGVTLKNDTDFAGYEPLTQTVFLFTKSEHLLDMFEALFLTCHERPAKMSAIMIDGNGESRQSRIVTLSGRKATLERKEEEKIRSSIEIEPVVGENDTTFDLRINYTDHSQSGISSHLNTCILLCTGVPKELLFGNTDGKQSSFRVKAVVMDTAR